MIERKNNPNLQYNNTAHSSKSNKLPVFRSAVSNGQNTSGIKFLLIGIIALIFFSLAAAPVSADIYITSVTDLENFRNNVNAGNSYTGETVTLTVNLELSSVCNATSDTSWTPIGTDSKRFNGTFDGNNKTISKLYINASSANYQGLFGYASSGATIKNLKLTGVKVTGMNNVGGLLGNYNSGITEGIVGVTIENCYVAGAVTGMDSVGGLVGGCGGNAYSSITNSYATVAVTGFNYVGGLVGGIGGDHNLITKCYATGNVNGSCDRIGGLVGNNIEATIENCYATGTVAGKGGSDGGVGGLVGVNYAGPINNSVALNPYVSGLSNVGRVAGKNDGGKITNCYAWKGMTNNGARFLSGGNNGTDASSSQVWNDIPPFYGSLSWDFTTIWQFNYTNPKYHLPVLQMNPDTTGLDASHLAPPININACNITVTNVTYNGMEQSPRVVVERDGFTFKENTDYTVTGNKQTSAGVYQLTIEGIRSLTGTVTKDWNISKVTLSPSNFTYTTTVTAYNGTAQPVIVTELIKGIGAVTIKYNGSASAPTAAGTYNVNISVDPSQNNTAASDLYLGYYIIDPRVFSDENITFTIEPDTYAFDGTAKEPTLNVTDKYTNLRITEFTASGSTTKTAAGEYSITVTGTGNYTAGSITKDWNITAVKEYIPTASETSFAYNRTAITLPVSYDSGNITASNLTFTSAGEYTAEFELKDKTNYTWYDETTANKTIEWNITKAALSADNFTYTAPSNLVYDGTAKTAQVIANDDIYGNGKISITYHNSTTNAVQSPVAAGTYKVNISVGEGTNYTAASDLHGDWVFTIEPRVFSEANIRFAIEPDTYAFNGTAIKPTLNVTDKDTNLRITEFTASGNTTETAAGEYSITVTGTGNYTAGTVTKDWNITKVAPQSIDFTLNPISKEYTGSNLTTAVTSKFGGMGTISNITYNGIENVKDVGTYTVRVNVTGGENYTAASLVEAGTFTITSPAQPKPSGGSSTDTGSGNYKEYDRSVTDGGVVTFGSSPTVTEVDLPKGTTGQVALIAESDVSAPEGKKTVKVFEINVPNYPSGKESVVKFKLTLAEIEKAGYTPSDVCLYHCNEKGVWTKLPTTYTIKDGVVYYEAVTTAFSPFAIVYEENGATEVSQPAVTPVKTQTAEPVSTYVEPTKTAIPTPEQTKSPVGLVGLGLGLLGAALVLRRK